MQVKLFPEQKNTREITTFSDLHDTGIRKSADDCNLTRCSRQPISKNANSKWKVKLQKRTIFHKSQQRDMLTPQIFHIMRRRGTTEWLQPTTTWSARKTSSKIMIDSRLRSDLMGSKWNVRNVTCLPHGIFFMTRVFAGDMGGCNPTNDLRQPFLGRKK